ncbi:MAG: ABC transporter ATP-binding protein [Alphaproteobacteria bacterium]|nr:ABC transporter ATP-binding protein [Alphaproteobacteria bacterium]
MSALLRFEGLSIEGCPPGGAWQTIVRDFNQTVDRGEVVALIGESGAGKSTIAHAALGYVRPGCRVAAGRVFLSDMDVLSLDVVAKRALRGRRVAYVAQSAAAAFNPALTIESQINEIAEVHRIPSAERTPLPQIFRRLGLPDPDRIGRRYPHQVSGGQLQRLMIAMAMSGRPDVLVLDEPTTALDVTTQIEVLATIREVIRDRGTAVIYVSHDLAVVAQVADRIVVLLKGDLVEQGSTDAVIGQPRADYTRRLIGAVRPRPGIAGTSASIIEPTPDAAPILECDGIVAAYGGASGIPVLHDVVLRVDARRVVAVVGESGSGKSTLARVIAGLLPPRTGSVRLQGQPLPASVSARQRDTLRRVQIVFQMPDTSLNHRQSIATILGRPLQFYFGMDEAGRCRRVAELLDMVEMPADLARRYPGELSGGQKQRIGIARALAAEPDVVLCDEVTSSLDTIVGAAVLELMMRLKQSLGIAYVYISHDLSTVAAVADDIVVFYAGRVVESGRAEAIFRAPMHPYTRMLLSCVPEMRRGWLDERLALRDDAQRLSRSVTFAAEGCAFADRCAVAIPDLCRRVAPPRRDFGEGHVAICHREARELASSLLIA